MKSCSPCGVRCGSLAQKIQPNVNQLIWWSSTFRFPGKETFNSHWLDNPDKIRAVAAQDKGMHKAAYYLPQFITPAIWWKDRDGKFYLLEDPYLKELAEKNRRIPGNTAKKMPEIPADAIRFASDDEYRAKLGADFIEKNKILPASYHVDVIWTPELADHFVWGIQKRIQLGVGGIYFDGLGGNQDYSWQGGWTDPDGKQRPSFHYDEKRTLFKRARALIKRNNPEEFIVAHMSGTRPLSSLSLCDGIIPGETFFYWYHPPEKRDASPDGDFYYAHIIGDIDNLKGEFFWRQWGLPHILLPEVRGKDRGLFKQPHLARGTRTMLAYTLHFDMLYWPTMCDPNEIYKLYPIRNEYGMADTEQYVVEFIPYWENQWFKTDDPNVKLSYYDHLKQHELYSDFDYTKKIMLIASNLQFSDSEFTITLPSNLKNVRVCEMQTGKDIPVENGKFKYNLIAYDFAIFEITGEMK